jgi:hypothetical protein
MNVEVVVARYCEDLRWTHQFTWPVTIYDKSAGGPRQHFSARNWHSTLGPNSAKSWPGSLPLVNVGGEAHTYLYHIVQHYNDLAEHTLFTQGHPFDHVPEFLSLLRNLNFTTKSMFAFGQQLFCDIDGWPQHERGTLPELKQLCDVFRVMRTNFAFHAGAIFFVNKQQIQKIPLKTWQRALDLCTTRAYGGAMERLWETIFQSE